MNKPKFRAWDEKNNRMLDDIIVNSEGDVFQYAEVLYDTPNVEIEYVRDVILMQYTGLKDKNGVEIYEGDVVKQVAGEYSYIGTVEKDCYQFYIDGIDPLDAYSFDDVADTSNCTADLEIIGNIHANPELLSGVE